MKRIIPLALCAALLLCAPALAAPEDGATDGTAHGSAAENRFVGEIGYSGVVDAETGYAPGATHGDETRVELSDTMYYDREAQVFVFPLDGGAELRAGAADGMIVSEPVALSAEGELDVTVYRNGEAFEPENGVADQIGEYVVNRADGGMERRVMGFTVVGESTNAVTAYSMPEGFLVRDATLNGEEAPYDRYRVDMMAEGAYHIEYRCPLAGLERTLDVTVDRTAPELLLDGRLDGGGRVRSAVEFQALEDGVAIGVTRDGEPQRVLLSGGAGRLTDTGSYVVNVTDPAGNTTTYEFTIVLYLDTNAAIFLALASLALAGVLGYVLWRRKNLRVR